MGDYDLMTIAFLMDTALYYLVAVQPVYNESADRLGMPPFYGDGAELGLYPMRFYQGRLVAIAKRKMALGIYGNHNGGRRPRSSDSRPDRSARDAVARPSPVGEGRGRERPDLRPEAETDRGTAPATSPRPAPRGPGRPARRADDGTA
ncbi:MAG: hypothetical protein IPN03_11010 [Holophagales bacterium]|nr:hypothetical protein [Holophagales bacterium]